MAGPARRHVTTSIKELEEVPLFMTELPAADEGENDALEALRSLVYDDTPEGVAANLKEQANDQYKQRNFRQAMGFYSQAIKEVGDKLSSETLAVLHCNRAACHLELQNYGSCVRDCASVITAYQRSTKDSQKAMEITRKKALYRSSRALIALDKLDQALDALELLTKLQINEPDPLTAGLLETVTKRLADLQAAKLKQDTREQSLRTSNQCILDRLKSLHLSLPPKMTIEQAMGNAPPPFQAPHLDQAYDHSEGEYQPLLLPVFILRPTNQPPSRDLIPEWAEDVAIQDQLAAFDPGLLDFDLFTITRRGRILRLGKKLTLKQICAKASSTKNDEKDSLELIGGWSLEIYAVETGKRSENWIAEMKRDLKARGLVA